MTSPQTRQQPEETTGKPLCRGAIDRTLVAVQFGTSTTRAGHLPLHGVQLPIFYSVTRSCLQLPTRSLIRPRKRLQAEEDIVPF